MSNYSNHAQILYNEFINNKNKNAHISEDFVMHKVDGSSDTIVTYEIADEYMDLLKELRLVNNDKLRKVAKEVADIILYEHVVMSEDNIDVYKELIKLCNEV